MRQQKIPALGRALRALGEEGEELGGATTEAKLHEIAKDLRRALALLEETVEGPEPTTRCAEHPYGPRDESAPDLCLLCETRRRGGRRVVRLPDGERDYQVAPSRYGERDERPQARERWLPEMWNGRTWQLCGTPRHDRREAEAFLAAERRGPHAGSAYRLVQEFTDYEVVRGWGSPVRRLPDTMGGRG
ncbi:hypothetical protein ACQYWQ_07260 [Streptomyces sp. P6-2-1]|uniref:hypothetical protein n=1 Tax=unclassified Streptomyces TaxID=2593676 RepID=UPI003D362F89